MLIYFKGVLNRGEMSVYVLAGNSKTLLWKFAENVGDIWNAAQATIQIPNYYDNFTIAFEGNYPESVSNKFGKKN